MDSMRLLDLQDTHNAFEWECKHNNKSNSVKVLYKKDLIALSSFFFLMLFLSQKQQQ